MEAINLIGLTAHIIEWLLLWVIASSVAIFIFRAIKLARMPFGETEMKENV